MIRSLVLFTHGVGVLALFVASDGRFGYCSRGPFGRRRWSTSTPRVSTSASARERSGSRVAVP